LAAGKQKAVKSQALAPSSLKTPETNKEYYCRLAWQLFKTKWHFHIYDPDETWDAGE